MNENVNPELVEYLAIVGIVALIWLFAMAVAMVGYEVQRKLSKRMHRNCTR